MWPRFITSLTKKEKEMKKMNQPCKGLNVNDEYLHAVRTKSFADFFVKVSLSESNLLEPGQEAIATILESYLFSSKPSHHLRLKSLLLNYFDISAEASSFCSHLLKTLNQIQSEHRCIHRIIDAIDHDHSSQLISELRSCVILNTATVFSKLDFSHIHDKHSSVLQRLKSSRKRVARKIKMMRFFNRVSGVFATAACGLVAAAAIFLAVHTLTALLLGPAIFSVPIKPLKDKIGNLRLMKYGFLRKIVEQLDVAAKGAYILDRDFDTMGRLVARLQDEIEHKKAMIEFCLERSEDRLSLQVLKELKKYEFGFSRQVEEVEEHVYLCLVTINRARAMVVKEISTSTG